MLIKITAPPKVTNAKIIGELKEGSKVTVSGIVTGGTEGSSRVQWFKTKSATHVGEEALETLSSSKIAKVQRCVIAASCNCLFILFLFLNLLLVLLPSPRHYEFLWVLLAITLLQNSLQ